MTEKTLIQADLAQFYGTENWYYHPLYRSILYTDGVKYVADHGGAHWLIDAIASAQSLGKVAAEEFQVWEFNVAQNRTAYLSCEDGNGHLVYSEKYDWTDFPLEKIKFYFTDRVILLPSEY